VVKKNLAIKTNFNQLKASTFIQVTKVRSTMPENKIIDLDIA